MAPFLSVAWPAAASLVVRSGVGYSSGAGAGESHTHTLHASAAVGDLLLMFAGCDSSTGMNITFSPADVTQGTRIGTFRGSAWIYTYAIDAGDVSTGSVTWDIEAVGGTNEPWRLLSMEVVGATLTGFPVQSATDLTTSNRTSAPAVSLSGVGVGNLVWAVVVNTPDTGNTLTITDLSGFTSTGDPVTGGAGEVQIWVGYLISGAGGSITGPSYALDGAGQVIQHGIFEVAKA